MMIFARSAAGTPASPPVTWLLEDVKGLVRLPLGQGFADAEDGGKPGSKGGLDLFVHRLIGLAEILPPLGVADDDMAAAGINEHLRRDFAGEGPFLLPVAVLGGEADIACRQCFA